MLKQILHTLEKLFQIRKLYRSNLISCIQSVAVTCQCQWVGVLRVLTASACGVSSLKLVPELGNITSLRHASLVSPTISSQESENLVHAFWTHAPSHKYTFVYHSKKTDFEATANHCAGRREADFPETQAHPSSNYYDLRYAT